MLTLETAPTSPPTVESTPASPARLSSTTGVAVVLGPLTRLGQALIRSDWAARQQLVLVARDSSDERRLGQPAAHAHVFRTDGTAAWFGAIEAPVVRVVCCAAGCIHPGRDDAADSWQLLKRDLDLIATALRSAVAGRIDVVLISSAVALSPPAGRNAYAGWKLIAETAVGQLVQATPGARLAVVYPGRLIERRQIGQPASWLYTTYGSAAAAIASAAERAPVRRVLGLDARLWLGWRAGRSAMASLAGRRG